jgi:hypothetical protein
MLASIFILLAIIVLAIVILAVWGTDEGIEEFFSRVREHCKQITAKPSAQPLSSRSPPPQQQPKVGKHRRSWKTWMATALGILGASVIASLFFGSRPSINPVVGVGNIHLQSAANRAIKKDYRNSGIEFSAYYKGGFSRSVLVLDLEAVFENNSKLDVFRALLDIAQEMKDESFETVELAHRGTTKFILDAAYFRKLGHERDYQNPAYTIRTFPENLRTLTGGSSYGQWTGGMIGVLTEQMNDFNDFHDKWYLDDLRYGR